MRLLICISLLLIIIVNSCQTVRGQQQQGQIKIKFDSGQFYQKGNYYLFGCVRNSPEQLPPPVTPKQCDVSCTSRATFETFVPVWRTPCVGTENRLFGDNARLYFSLWNKNMNGTPPATFVAEKSITISEYLSLGLDVGAMLELDFDPMIGRIFVQLFWTPSAAATTTTSGKDDNGDGIVTTTTTTGGSDDDDDNYDSD